MTREQLITMCDKLGDQSLPSGERWKSIVHLKYDNNSTIALMEQMVAEDKVAFVDWTDTVDGKLTTLCGFILLETMTMDTMHIPLTGNLELGQGVTFINVDWILGATFRNGPKGNTHTKMSELAASKF
jgi:hypothetical protein